MINYNVLTPNIINQRFNEFLKSETKQVQLMNTLADVVIKDVTDHIRAQREITDDKGLKRNADNTLKNKARKGKPPLSLIDYGFLLKPTSYKKKITQKSAIISRRKSVNTPKGSIDYDCIGVKLQNQGYNFWGVSPSARVKIVKRLIQFVKRLIFR